MKTCSILIVEDNQEVSVNLRKILEKRGYRIASSLVTGEEAIEYLKKNDSDLVLMDINLPGKLDGIDTAVLINRDFGVPVICITGESTEAFHERIKEAAPYGYLSKPFKMEDLIISIETAITRYSFEKRLRESENRYRNIFELSGDAIMILENGEKIISANRMAEELFGLSKDDMEDGGIGGLEKNIIAPPDNLLFDKIRASIPVSAEISYKKPDKTFLYLELKSWVIDKSKNMIQLMARDITGRKKSELALKKLASNREELERIINLSSAIVMKWIPQNELRVDFISGNVSLLGYKPDDFYSGKTSLKSLIHPDDFEELKNKINHVCKKKSVNRFDKEYRIKDASGEWHWIDDKTWVVRNNQGKVLHLYALMLDITDRKNTELALAENEYRFRSLVSNIPGVVLRNRFDENFTVEYMTDMIDEIAGYPASDFYHNRVRTFRSIIYPEDAIAFTEKLNSGSDSNDSFNIDYRIINAAGDLKWVNQRAHLVRDSEKGVYIDSVIFDITEKKQSEETLFRVNTEIESLLSSISSVLIGVSPGDIVTHWNRSAEETFGLSSEIVLGKNLTEAGINWEWGRIYEGISQSITEDKAIKLNSVKYLTAGKKQGLIDVNIAPIMDMDQKLSGFLVLGEDITERKFLEMQLAQAQKLESIGQLAAGVAHEINTPTQYISDNTRFLKESCDEIFEIIRCSKKLIEQSGQGEIKKIFLRNLANAINKADTEYLMQEVPLAIDQSLEGLERVSNIVQSMKQFSHPGSSEKKGCDINSAIRNTITVTRNEWKYLCDLEFRPDDSIENIPCYSNEFNQAILNIIINASHALKKKQETGSREKGIMRIETEKKDQSIIIRISDNGVGIPEKITDRIFDPFFTTKDVGEGTGQGLAIVHNIIVNRHGGSIKVDSKAGEGTTFEIIIPAT